ncbi:hypothetical protein BGZ51_008705, partial [Haplosporangium sp. Z 767]
TSSQVPAPEPTTPPRQSPINDPQPSHGNPAPTTTLTRSNKAVVQDENDGCNSNGCSLAPPAKGIPTAGSTGGQGDSSKPGSSLPDPSGPLGTSVSSTSHNYSDTLWVIVSIGSVAIIALVVIGALIMRRRHLKKKQQDQQLLACKLNELLSVWYKRLSAEVLPLKLTSAVGGTDYWLTEVRNIIKTPQDVTALWGCKPGDIKVLGLDLGQACVSGASALLPDEPEKPKKGKKVQRDQHGDAPMKEPSDTMKSVPRPADYYNLAVK